MGAILSSLRKLADLIPLKVVSSRHNFACFQRYLEDAPGLPLENTKDARLSEEAKTIASIQLAGGIVAMRNTDAV